MKQSQLFSRPSKFKDPKGADSANHRLLVQGGFIDQLMSGVYTYLPLGYRVLKNIENIVREEMESTGGQEILMPTLQPKENWEKTGRWDSMDDLFRFTSYYGKKEYALGPTHEEILSPLAKKNTFSYKEFPFAVYQIQTKFRDEKRAKSGMLRGREFLMKDYYSFHTSEDDLEKYYEKMKKVYKKVFDRLGIGEETYLTYASGGSFSKFSHEYQTATEAGEDTIYLCEKCKVAINEDIIKEMKNQCPECEGKKLRKLKAIETGNIFKIMDRFTKPFDYKYVDQNGKEQNVLMGCYGMGISRIMGTIVEVHHDDKGIKWPEAVNPYKIHLLNLGDDTREETEKVYNDLKKAGKDVLWDDRDVTHGTKLVDSDLIGIPTRIVVSKKTLKEKSVEVKKRYRDNAELVKKTTLLKVL